MSHRKGSFRYCGTDHDWWLTQSEWTNTLTQTGAATVPGQFVALRGVEWTHDTAGHINVFNTDTLINRTHPMFGDLSDFYTWLAANPDVIAQFNHPDPTYGGTFYDFALHPAAAQMVFLQEIGNNARRYTTYEPSFIQSNTLGWKIAPTINSDSHGAGWGVDTPARTGIVAPALTQDELFAAMRARRVFATEDSNLALTLRLDGAWMGATLPPGGALPLTVDWVDPDPEPITLYLYDRNRLLATISLTTSTGQWSAAVEALPGHYFWVKGVQGDGNQAYTAPVWIEGQAAADMVYINEILPSPQDVDWDGNGLADHEDEWIEFYNPANQPVGLGGWQVRDSSGSAYNLPLDLTIPPGGFTTIYHAQMRFALNNSGDTVTLVNPNGDVVDSVGYGHTPGYDESWCRLPDGQTRWSHDCGPSPNAPNWELERRSAGPLKVKIFEARRLAYNAWVRISGRVTVPPGVLGDRYMYIQDDTSGILIYLPKEHRLSFELGDEVRIIGNVRTFHEESEIAVSERQDVDFIKPGPPLPPLPIATTSLLEPYEGVLVMLQGQAVRFQGRLTLWVDDGTDPAKVVIRSSTGIRKPFIEPGTPITVVGVVSQYSDPSNPTRYDYRLLPRYQFDLVLPIAAPATPIPPENWPILLPETGH